MLPFLIFGIGYNMKRRRFFRNLGSIILNGVLGTVLNFVLLTAAAWIFSNNSESISGITLEDSMTLGGVLSCTEMVVSLSILNEKKTPKLNSILFGESLISTAISILIVKAVNLIDFDDLNPANFFTFLGYFFYNCILSTLFGFLFGLLSSLMTKNFTRIRNDPSKEVALQFYIAWTGYIIAEIFYSSGVNTILLCAIISGHYAYYNMKPDSRIVVTDTFHLIGDGTRALIFSYLGLTCFSYSPEDISFTFIFYMLMAIFCSRFITTFGIALLLKLFSKNYTFECKHLVII